MLLVSSSDVIYEEKVRILYCNIMQHFFITSIKDYYVLRKLKILQLISLMKILYIFPYMQNFNIFVKFP